MTNLFLGSPSVSFAVLLGDNVIRIKDGKLKQLEHIPIYSPPLFNADGDMIFQDPRIPRAHLGDELNLKIITTIKRGFEISHYNEPISALPIGDKRVDDCTIEELLFAVKHKLTK